MVFYLTDILQLQMNLFSLSNVYLYLLIMNVNEFLQLQDYLLHQFLLMYTFFQNLLKFLQPHLLLQHQLHIQMNLFAPIPNYHVFPQNQLPHIILNGTSIGQQHEVVFLAMFCLQHYLQLIHTCLNL